MLIAIDPITYAPYVCGWEVVSCSLKTEIKSGPLVTINNLGLLDSLGRRMII